MKTMSVLKELAVFANHSLVLELSVHIYSKAEVLVCALGRILRSYLGAFEDPCDLAAWGPVTFEPVRWVGPRHHCFLSSW